MPFVRSVPDVRLVQPVACRVVPKWSPACPISIEWTALAFIMDA